MNNLRWTKHAATRMQQRGFTKMTAELLVVHSDLVTPLGRNLVGFRMSHQAVDEAVDNGLPRAIAERLVRRCAVVADDGAILTLVHVHGTKSGAYKRRDRRAFWK